ncbi:MAG: hypothetical protein WA432_04995 [Candidatus Babeliaceae bacterium]
MHNVDDIQLSINDARQLYCILRKNHNENVYLFETNADKAHINILNYDNEEEKIRKIAAIQTIYKKHGLPHHEMGEVNLQQFQPSIEDIQQKIDESTGKSFFSSLSSTIKKLVYT